MNNSRGKTLLASIKEGDLVSIRTDEGNLKTSRAQWNRIFQEWELPGGYGITHPITQSNIVAIRN